MNNFGKTSGLQMANAMTALVIFLFVELCVLCVLCGEDDLLATQSVGINLPAAVQRKILCGRRESPTNFPPI